VAEVVADHSQSDAGLQQGDCAAVAQYVRGDPTTAEAWC
jgi:hypothetical protein